MMRLTATVSLTALAVVTLAGAAPARAQIVPEMLQVEHRPPVGLQLSLGVRAEQLRGGGVDAFSDDHALTELMLAASYRVAGSPEGGLTAGVTWNHGSSSASARGTNSSLDLDRLSLSLSLHRAVGRRLTVFARVAPGAVRVKVGLAETSALGANDYSTDTTLGQTHWALAVEGAVGAAFRVGEVARPHEHVFALWLIAEGGYSLAGSTTLALGASGGPPPARTDVPLQLGTLTPGGAFMNFAAALTF